MQAKKEDLQLYGFDESRPLFGSSDGQQEDNASLQGRGNTRRQTYAAMVTGMDRGIGKILMALKEAGIEKNTLVLFFSDNGAAPGYGGSSGTLKGHKFQEWDGGVRAPAIIKWPQGFGGGRTVDQLTGYIDVVPTLREITGISRNTSKPLDGLSLLPALREEKHIRRDMYLGYGSLISGRWKLVTSGGGNPKMELDGDILTHLLADPEEKENVREEYPRIYKQLKRQLKPYEAIRPARQVPPYGQGRKGFEAPADWKIIR